MLLKIKELRKSKKLSQQDLADKINVSVRMFAEYENETSDIPLKKLQKIAEVLEVSFFDLFQTNQISTPLPTPSSNCDHLKTENKLLKEQIELYKKIIK